MFSLVVFVSICKISRNVLWIIHYGKTSCDDDGVAAAADDDDEEEEEEEKC